MPPIRIAALVALLLAALVAIGSLFIEGMSEGSEALRLLVLMVMITANVVGVLAATRDGGSGGRIGAVALWLVMAGVGCGLVVVSTPMWSALLLPAPTLVTVGEYMATLERIVIPAAIGGIAAMLTGWALWGAAWLLARRRAA